MKSYTLAFMFDKALAHVLLVHKLTPEWQKGYINGIGKIDYGETSVACISREVKEETTLNIPKEQWFYLGQHFGPDWNVDTYTTVYKGNRGDAQKGDKEEIEWFAINKLPNNVLTNLPWLNPLALDKIKTPILKAYTVEYT